MRFIMFVLLAALAGPAIAQEQSVLATPAPVAASAYVSAQDHALALACSGGFGHCARRGGYYEGIGFSTVSPDAAVRRCCFWGLRRPREVGTAWCPHRRGWVAVVRYY